MHPGREASSALAVENQVQLVGMPLADKADGLEALGGQIYDRVLGVQSVDGLALLDHRLGIGGGGLSPHR